MAQRQKILYSQHIFLYATTFLSIVHGLMLPNQVTQSPKHSTKFNSSIAVDSVQRAGAGGAPVAPPAAPSAASKAAAVAPKQTTTKDNSGAALYRLISQSTDTTCILLKTDAVVEVKFKLHDLEEQADSFIPAKALVDGRCTSEDESFMRITWDGYSLEIYFAKTPGGERWYIGKIELAVSTQMPAFHGINARGNLIKLYHRQMLIPTQVGKSYSCQELDIDLETDEADHPPRGVRGSILFRLLQVQPFMYKSNNFETAFECKGQQEFRSETAPIAVGSTLAIAVLATVGGYAAYRYFKVKNVQYNTME